MSNRLQKHRKAERIGRLAEWFAAFALLLKGYRVIALRYKTRVGEIDLIARKGNLVAIVEVKARPTIREAVEAVTLSSRKRIDAAADLWLAKQRNYASLSIRYDIVAVCPWRWPVHFKDAF